MTPLQFLQVAFRIVDPATITAAVVVGVAIGWFFIPALVSVRADALGNRLPWTVALAMFVFTTPLIFAIMVSRALEQAGSDAPTWPGWIGLILLRLIEISATYLTLKVRAR